MTPAIAATFTQWAQEWIQRLAIGAKYFTMSPEREARPCHFIGGPWDGQTIVMWINADEGQVQVNRAVARSGDLTPIMEHFATYEHTRYPDGKDIFVITWEKE